MAKIPSMLPETIVKSWNVGVARGDETDRGADRGVLADREHLPRVDARRVVAVDDGGDRDRTAERVLDDELRGRGRITLERERDTRVGDLDQDDQRVAARPSAPVDDLLDDRGQIRRLLIGAGFTDVPGRHAAPVAHAAGALLACAAVILPFGQAAG